MGSGGGCCIKNCCVFDIGGAIKRIFGGSKGSSSGGRTESYDSNVAELEATIKVQKALTEFKTDTQNRSTKFEEDIIKESREYLDEFINDMRKYNKIRYGGRSLNINISSIERENRKTEDKIHGFIVKKVATRISLDDSECLGILKMDAGAAKTNKLDEFYQKVLKEAVLELSDILRNSMEKQSDNIEERIQQRIDGIMDICETKTSEFERIQDVKESGEDEMEREQLRLSHIIAMCDYGILQMN
ncbi:MAG: hypothetical protein IJV50_08710 [Lachnospiraceae bacterium]|nr:hypothetical protein [Lachnospiraceae bacterium]